MVRCGLTDSDENSISRWGNFAAQVKQPVQAEALFQAGCCREQTEYDPNQTCQQARDSPCEYRICKCHRGRFYFQSDPVTQAGQENYAENTLPGSNHLASRDQTACSGLCRDPGMIHNKKILPITVWQSRVRYSAIQAQRMRALRCCVSVSGGGSQRL